MCLVHLKRVYAFLYMRTKRVPKKVALKFSRSSGMRGTPAQIPLTVHEGATHGEDSTQRNHTLGISFLSLDDVSVFSLCPASFLCELASTLVRSDCKACI